MLYYFNESSDIFPVLIPSLEADYFIAMHANLGVTECILLGSLLWVSCV